MSCTTFYEALVKTCPGSIVLVAGLAASTEYYWLITGISGKVYQRKATTDATGKLTIDTSMLPAGMLNEHAGSFFLEVRQGDNYLAKVKLTIDAVQWDGVLMNFQSVTGDTGINNQIPANA
jgi:hypothetical protein